MVTDDSHRSSCVTGDKPPPGRTGPKRKMLVDLFQGEAKVLGLANEPDAVHSLGRVPTKSAIQRL